MATPVTAPCAERELLPKNVKPIRYALTLTPDLTKFTFAGELRVAVNVLEATDKITVNSQELEVHEASFTPAAGSALTATTSYDVEGETATFTLASAAPVGPGELFVKFTGIHNDKLKGFYRSKYVVGGEERYMVCSQMEPVDCRRVMPCWDEPDLKAVFSVALRVPAKLTALSNMPVTSEMAEADNTKLVSFADTPIMSTYLLALIVGEFDYLEEKTPQGLPVRVYTPLGKREQGRFALDVAVKTLPFYNEYFGTPYPLPKYDMIAIADFAAGAMENWGLVTYRETALLVEPGSSSAAHKQWVALVVGHETAHQWFGNLVTMQWWESLWLNEGFASWVEYLCVDFCFPQWDIWTQFVYADMGRALSVDGLKSSHPVEVPVQKAADVDEVFDIISYSKGCTIVRMLQQWLGAEPFRVGMGKYLQKFAYSNAVTEDLWDALGESTGQPVKKVMTSWTKITGYPVLTVEEQPAGADGVRRFALKQSRFLSSGEKIDDGSLWMVPLSWVSQANATGEPGKQLLEQRDSSVDVRAAAGEWIKFNAGQTGMYRVLYPASMLAGLRGAVEAGALPTLDRIGLINDALSLAAAGLLPIGEALSLCRSYAKDVEYTVWADLSSKLSEVELLVSNTDFYEQWEQFGRALFGQVARTLGWDATEGENHGAALLRPLALGRLGRYGDADTLREANARFDAFLANNATLSPDLRTTVYALVLRHGNADTYDKVLSVMRTTDLHEERERVMRSLGSPRDVALLQRSLDLALSAEIRSQDAVSIIGAVAGNPRGRQLAWEFIQANWSKLTAMYEGGFILTRLIGCVSGFASEEKAVEVEQFYTKNAVAGTERTVKQTLEAIRLNAAWLARDGPAIKAFLEAQKY